MTRFAIKRILALIPTMLAIVIISFIVIHEAPGSPFSSERAMSAESLAAMNQKYGFDKPVHIQLMNYIGGLLQGDLGLSTKYPGKTINEIIADGLPSTLILGFCALLWAIVLGVSAGIIGAVKQNTAADYAAMTGAMLGISVPSFVLGPLLILIFSLTFYWFPPAGWGSFRHVILPAIALGTTRASYIARLTRGGILEVIRSDFIRTAHAKGLSERTVIFRHLLKGGLMPVVTFLGPATASMMVGSVVVEKIFALPGIGPYFVDAAFNRDYFLVMGIIIVYSTFLLAMNLLVDLAYGFLDPRVRYE